MITINDENENDEIFALMSEYAAMREELDPLINRMNEYEKRIKELAAKYNDSVVHAGVRAMPKAGRSSTIGIRRHCLTNWSVLRGLKSFTRFGNIKVQLRLVLMDKVKK